MLNGPMGLANAQRSLDYIRIIAEFISQPEYRDVVPLFGVTNEPYGMTIGQPAIQAYYLQAYDIVRTASGQGNNPMISFHNGFFSNSEWYGFLPDADRVSLDIHPYIAFGDQSDAGMGTYTNTPCSAWGQMMNQSMAGFGLTVAGEFSNAVTDCGLWVNGVNQGIRYEGSYYMGGPWPDIGSCNQWTDWQSWSSTMKKEVQQFALASMDALQNWFFWTWKVGNSSVTGTVESPAWSYQLGLENGWMPADPRVADGTCNNANPFTGTITAGSGNVPASVTNGYVWPPSVSNGGDATDLPQYTPTGSIPTLPVPTFTPTGTVTSTATAGNGWENAQDTAGLMVSMAGCSYLDPWVNPTAAPPSPLCPNSKRDSLLEEREPVPEPQITSRPIRRRS